MSNVVKEYKVAYWKDGNTIQSKMFDVLENAIIFVGTLSSEHLATVMRLESNNQGDYSWKILPISVGKYIPISTKIYQYRWSILIFSFAAFLVSREGK